MASCRWRRSSALTLCAFFGILSVTPDVYAQKSKLSPSKSVSLKEDLKSFRACKKDAFQLFRSQKLSKREFGSELARCRDRFPAADLAQRCKKAAKKHAEGNRAAYTKALSQCSNIVSSASFSPKEPIPFYVHGDELLFAGVGLNRPVSLDNPNLPNFDCSQLNETSEEKTYMLFGDDPRNFAGFSQWSGDQLKNLLRQGKKAADREIEVASLGQFSVNDKNIGLFFPLRSCSFSSKIGEMFRGMTLYYLVDEKRKLAMPYFGVAFYSEKLKPAYNDAKKVALALAKKLGKGFRPASKKDEKYFISQRPIKSFDHEGDPSNLCRKPRRHDLVGVVKGETKAVDYVLVAKISNLCQFGDRQSADFRTAH